MKRFILAAAFAAIAYSACDRTQPVGPAERAGRHIDNAANEVHDDAVRTERNAEDIGHDIKRRVKNDDDAEDRRERRYDD